MYVCTSFQTVPVPEWKYSCLAAPTPFVPLPSSPPRIPTPSPPPLSLPPPPSPHKVGLPFFAAAAVYTLHDAVSGVIAQDVYLCPNAPREEYFARRLSGLYSFPRGLPRPELPLLWPPSSPLLVSLPAPPR